MFNVKITASIFFWCTYFKEVLLCKILRDDINIRDIASTFFFGVLSAKRQAVIVFLYVQLMFIRKKVALKIIDKFF